MYMSFEYDLICAMREYDLHTNSLNLEPGKYHRFRSLGTCKTKCCEYRVFENQIGAHFKCFRRGIDRFWFADSDHKPSLDERRQMAEERDRVDRARKADQYHAAVRCGGFFDKLNKPPINHPYVTRKGIYPHYARAARSLCVIPVRNIDYEIQSLQFIKRNGFKQFKTGAPSSSGMIWLTPELPADYRGVIRICEGWSTGCTIHMLTKSPVVCALNAYNLPKVAVLIRRHFIHAVSKICADNDQWGKENVGLIQARQAAAQAGMSLHYPTFDDMNVGHKPTDFNDLFAMVGVEATRRQLILIRK
jgi:putative DNA primase/helicase